MKPLIYILFAIVLILYGCKKFEYSPYQQKPTAAELPSNLNQQNIDRLMTNVEAHDDTVTILFTGDSQRFYDQLKKLVTKVNTIPHIDFMIISGDIADFGVMREYLWIYDELQKLNVPYFTAIGNHDLAADEGEVYSQMFGNKNYSFIYKGYKFIFHDTNGREYNFDGTAPDMEWLSAQLADSSIAGHIGVSHIAPYNGDFDKVLSKPYKELLAATPNFMFSLHGHEHGTRDIYYENVRYITSNSVQKSEAILLKIINGEVIKQFIAY